MQQPLLFASYYSILMVVAVYAIKYGGWPERAGASVIVIGSVLSTVTTFFGHSTFEAVEPGLFGIDVVVLAALFWISLKCNRFWPLWATAFHLIGVLTHLAVLVNQAVVPEAYAWGAGLWAYPMLAALLLGSERCRRLRLGESRSASPR